MRLTHLWLTDFRNYPTAELEPAAGLTAVLGGNGEGKTNLLEAVGYLATLSSFRGAPGEALVRAGAAQAVVRAEVEALSDEGRARTTSIEAELHTAGRDRVLVNKQPLRRARDLLGSVRTTVFSPDDLALVKGGPAERRRLLDETLVACAAKHDALQGDLDRILRQRNTLLKQAAASAHGKASRLTPDIVATLDVWDAKLADVGEQLGALREELCTVLAPAVAAAYDAVAPVAAHVGLHYEAIWRDVGLAAALAAARDDDVRRAVSTVGPHRDEVALSINGLPARTHASQGEQRSLALALRLATHAVVGERAGSSPILLLDDVFSELDDFRSAALLRSLPPGQALLTAATDLPDGAEPDLVVRVRSGAVAPAALPREVAS